MASAEESLEEIRTAYDTVATSYASLLADTSYEASLDLAMIRHFAEELGTRDGIRVLDAGCGAGRMLAHLESISAPGVELEGVDLSPGMIEEARARHPTRDFAVADLRSLPFEDSRFDGALYWYSIIHTPGGELGGVLAELRRVLRPQGSVLLGFQAGRGSRAIPQAYGHSVTLTGYLHEDLEVQRALEDEGFAVRARLRREPRPGEKHAQAFVLAERIR